jgi:tight adherence protein C
VIPVLLAGAGVGAGLWLIWRAATARPTLAELAATMASTGRPVQAAAIPAAEALEQRLVRRLIAALAGVGLDPNRRAADLRVTGRTVEQFTLLKVAVALGGLLFATIIIGLLFEAPPLVTLFVAVVLATGGWLLPDLTLTGEAKDARKAFRHALGSFLDLVNVIEAAGGGPETALYTAADAGDGPAFSAIRDALEVARHARRSVWSALGDLGQDLQVSELTEFAASLALTEDQGARIRQTLAAKADSMRAQQVSEARAEAEAATERMTIPVVLLLFAFLILIAYPAVASIGQVGSP